MELTKETLLKTKAKINKLKRAGWKLTPDTKVMLINDKPITYRQFKRMIKRLG